MARLPVVQWLGYLIVKVRWKIHQQMIIKLDCLFLLDHNGWDESMKFSDMKSVCQTQGIEHNYEQDKISH